MQNTKSGVQRGGGGDGRSAADGHFPDGVGGFAVVGVGVGDFRGGKAALVQHDYAAFGPDDGLSYVHACYVLTKSNCNQAGEGRRIGIFAVQCPGGMWVNPLVATMEVKAIMEL